jgi:hypothetical protein
MLMVMLSSTTFVDGIGCDEEQNIRILLFCTVFVFRDLSPVLRLDGTDAQEVPRKSIDTGLQRVFNSVDWLRTFAQIYALNHHQLEITIRG